MPKVKLKGTDKLLQIPFTPNAIAALLDRGHEVFHDDNASEDQINQERLQVLSAFNQRKAKALLGEPQFKAAYERWKLRAPMGLREDDSFSKRLQSPGTINEGDILNVQPNPNITNMPEIDSNDLMLLQGMKKGWRWDL